MLPKVTVFVFRQKYCQVSGPPWPQDWVSKKKPESFSLQSIVQLLPGSWLKVVFSAISWRDVTWEYPDRLHFHPASNQDPSYQSLTLSPSAYKSSAKCLLGCWVPQSPGGGLWLLQGQTLVVPMSLLFILASLMPEHLPGRVRTSHFASPCPCRGKDTTSMPRLKE